MVGEHDPVADEWARLERLRRQQRPLRVERRIALAAALVLGIVPFVLFGNLVSTLRLLGGNVEGPGAVHTYEVLLVLAVVAFLVALVSGVRTGRTGVVVTALTMVPVVLIAGYVFAVPQGRWQDVGSVVPDRRVPACYSGTDSCAEYGG